MDFIISEIEKKDFLLNRCLNELRVIFNDHEGFCFIRHPLFGIKSGIDTPSLLIVSRFFGTIMIDIFDFRVDNIANIQDDNWHFVKWEYIDKQIFEEGEDKLSSIYGRVIADRILRKFSGKDNRLKGKYFLYLPNINRSSFKQKFGDLFKDKIIFSNELNEFFKLKITNFKIQIPEDIWKIFIGLLSGAHLLIKPERKVEPEKTKAGIIRKIENQIQIFDIEQMKVAQQIPPGPQRIRGLAGTGKTIVLALKAVYMHLNHPEWNIVYSFNTQSLYDYIYDLIKRFYQYWTGGREPNWKNLKILHGWGGKGKMGLYSYVSEIMKKKPRTYTEAKNFFEFRRNSELLGMCCSEIMKLDPPKLFDAILIDEAQDFDKRFFQFCYKILKSPKKLIWAYDELQSLEDINIPTAKDIFGVDKDGVPIVDLDGIYLGGIEKDFVLYKAYRNPKVILMTAHIFGMGLLRKDGAIQFLPNKGSWEDLGYIIEEGEFSVGNEIKINRLLENSPNMIEKFVSYKEILKVSPFNDKIEELNWIAEQIEKDIKEEKLRPEDILVIGFNNTKLFQHFITLQKFLKKKEINSFIIGKDVSINVFHLPNYVTFSTVFKAKGNEAISIYIFDFEYSESKLRIIQNRNMAFSSITRTKGWCTITGTGKEMKIIKEEINRIIERYPEIKFIVPDMDQIKRNLDSVEYEKRRIRIRKAERGLKDALRIIRESNGIKDLSEDTKKKLQDLVKKIENDED